MLMYNYNYPASNEMDFLFGGFLIVFVIVALILGVIGYIASAFIYYNTAKTNNLSDIAIISWIPVVNMYVLFALGSKKDSIEEIKKDALTFSLIYIALIILSAIPFLGILLSIAAIIIGVYFSYRLYYRWCGDTGKSVLFVLLTFITSGIFFFIYGLIKMKQPFVAA